MSGAKIFFEKKYRRDVAKIVDAKYIAAVKTSDLMISLLKISPKGVKNNPNKINAVKKIDNKIAEKHKNVILRYIFEILLFFFIFLNRFIT